MEIAEHTEGRKSGIQSTDETSFLNIDEQTGRTALIDGEEYLFFSGYAYLGMQQMPAFIESVKQGTDKYGWSFSSSRISNTRLKLFDLFEEQLSKLTGFQHTVAVSNGFTAGRMVMQLFAHKANFFTAPTAHPAVSEGLTKFKGSYDNWKDFVITSLNTQTQYLMPVIVTDTVNPLRGEINDLSFLQFIEKKCVCVIDDSHGIGLLGKNGEGVSSMLPKNPNIDYLLVYSLSKAFNLNGGAISTNNASFVKQLRQLPAYTGATGMNPALMHAFIQHSKLYAQQRDQLKENIQRFRNLIAGKSSVTHPTPELPIFLLNDVNEKQLSDQKIIISSFPYPDPKGKCIQRVVINALHTEADLQKLADALD